MDWFRTWWGWGVVSLLIAVGLALSIFIAAAINGDSEDASGLTALVGILTFVGSWIYGLSHRCGSCRGWGALKQVAKTLAHQSESRQTHYRRESVGSSEYASNTGHQSSTTHYADVPYVDVTIYKTFDCTDRCSHCGYQYSYQENTSNTNTYRA